MGGKGSQTERVCPVCNASFQVAVFIVSQGRGKYCSPQCAGRARRKPERNRYLRASGKKNCAQCGNDFPCFPGDLLRRKYCSIACKIAADRNEIERTCETCSETFSFAPSQLRANPGAGRYCSLKCRDEGLVRETAKRPRKNPKQTRKPDLDWRQAVLERDGHRCRRCGQGGHHAHHIAPRTRRPDLRNDLDNGACLCASCHGWVHAHPLEAEAAGLLSSASYEVARAAKLGRSD